MLGGGHVLIARCLIVELILAVSALITSSTIEFLLEVAAHLLSIVLEALILVPHGATTTTSATASASTREALTLATIGLHFFEF
jgi:hypothetical protein